MDGVLLFGVGIDRHHAATTVCLKQESIMNTDHRPRLDASQIRIRAITTRLLFLVLATLVAAFVLIHIISNPRVLASRAAIPKQERLSLAALSEQVTVRAEGGGNPWISLADGRGLVSTYVGEERLISALARNQATPLSLESADLDEDGVPDLIAGYRAQTGEGIVVVHRGNVDSIYPNSFEAEQRKANGEFTDAPFLSPASVYSVPAGAALIGAGDFDGDHHVDVVTADRGGRYLHFLTGDGHGGLSLSKLVALQGSVTALSVGGINARDGNEDIIVGITSGAGAKALIFEGPQGAMNTTPEEIDLPGAASSFALADLGNKSGLDLAIAAGHNLVIVHGRDNSLASDAGTPSDVPAPIVEMRTFSDEIRSVAAGRFADSGFDDLAVLFAQGRIEILNSPGGRLKGAKSNQALLRSPNAVDPGESSRSSHEGYAASEIDGSETSISATETWPIQSWSARTLSVGEKSGYTRLLRVRVSSSPVDNLLVTGDAAAEARVMVAGQKERSAVTGLKSGDVNDETVEAALTVGEGAVAALPMRLNKDALSDLVLLKAGDTTPNVIMTRPQSIFVVTNTNDSGAGSLRDQITLANNAAGADEIRFGITSGSGVRTISLVSPLPAVTGAVTIDGYTQTSTSQNTLTTGDNAVLAIELNGAGAGASNGLNITAGNSTVRGLVINRFSLAGINLMTNGSNKIEGNFIGVNSLGAAKLANLADGVNAGSSANTIGGTSPAARNVLSGNGANGVLLSGATSTGNNIQGNHIGTNAAGTISLGNSKDGVLVAGAPINTIGGISSTARNIIGGNANHGIELLNAQQFLVRFDSLGTDSTGTAALGNTKDGMLIYSRSTGTVRDVIVGRNGGAGIAKGASAQATLSPNVFIFSNVSGGLVFFNEFIAIISGCVAPASVQINSVSTSLGTMTVTGYYLDGARPNKAVTFDLYSGFVNATGDQFEGSLPTFLGTLPAAGGQPIVTNSIGLAPFSFSFSFSLPSAGAGQFINAAATADGNTHQRSNFRQVNAGCSSYSLSSTSATIPASGGTGSFQIQTQANCHWDILYDACTVKFDVSSGDGTRTVNYTLDPNPSVGTPLIFRFIVQGQVFTVTQEGAMGLGVGCNTRPINIGQPIADSISAADCNAPHRIGRKADVYTLNAVAGQTITINMNQDAFKQLDPYLILTTSDGTVLAANDDLDPGINQNSQLTYPITTSGTYRIEATTFDGVTQSRGPYSILVTANVCAQTSINLPQTLSQAITDDDCNDPFSGPAFIGFKTDLYTFNANAGQMIVATMTKLSSTIDPYLILIGPGGVVLAQDDDSAGDQSAQLSFTIPSTAMYTLEATTYKATDRGLYSLSLMAVLTCTFTVEPVAVSVGGASGNGSFIVNVQSGCNWIATSNAPPWLTTASTGSGQGTVNYSFQQNPSSSSRVGTITVGTATHTVTQAGTPAGPTITSACKGDGKQLIVNGSGFAAGARVILNGEEEKTSFVSSTQVIAKKAGKRAATGDTLQVRNPDATQTQVVSYTKNNCFVQ